MPPFGSHANLVPFLDGLGPSGPVDPLFDVTFTDLPDGGTDQATFEAVTGFTFARAGQATVQTSSSSLISGIAANYATVGSWDGTKRGFVLEVGMNTTSAFGNTWNPRIQTGGSSFGGTSAYSAPSIDRADGTNGQVARINGGSGTYGPFFQGITGTTSYSIMSWQRSVAASDMQQLVGEFSFPATATPALSTGGTTWRRLDNVWTANGDASAHTSVDCRDYAAQGGQTARARDIYVDYYCGSYQLFPTEVWDTGGRAPEFLSRASADHVSSSGRTRTLIRFYPKFDSSTRVRAYSSTLASPVNQAKYYIWRKDATHYVRIDAATMRVEIGNGAESFTSTDALEWSKRDAIYLFIDAGDGNVPTVQYARNNDTVTDLGGAGAISAFSLSGSVDWFCDSTASHGANDYGTLPCWYSQVTAFDDGDQAPVAVSLTSDVIDPDGTQVIGVNGWFLDNNPMITLDGNAVGLVLTTGNLVSFLTPAIASGSYPVQLSNDFGDADALTVESWSPDDEVWDGSWRYDYPPAAINWPANPTAGPSGSNGNLTPIGAIPAASSLDGYTGALLGGTQHFTGGGSSTFYSSTGVTQLSVFYIAGAQPAAGGSFWNDPALVTENTGNNALTLSSSGVRAGLYNGTEYKTAFLPVSLNQVHMAAMTWSPSRGMKTRLDQTDTPTIPVPSYTLAGTMMIGSNYTAAAKVTGTILMTYLKKTAVSDAVLTKFYQWLKLQFPTYMA